MVDTASCYKQEKIGRADHLGRDRYNAGSSIDVGKAYYPIKQNEKGYRWAEHKYEVGDISALVAFHKNIPDHLQCSVNKLVSEEYKKKLFSTPFYEASLLLELHRSQADVQLLKKRLEELHNCSFLEDEQNKAIEYVTSRNPDDLLVLVFKSETLIGSMSLFPFSKKQDIPSLSYLKLDPFSDKLPDVSGIGIGRLAKTSLNDCHVDEHKNDLTNTVAAAAAFVVARDFVLTKGLLKNPDSFICGDTYGTFLSCLCRFFPATITKSTINPDILNDESPVRAMAMYFFQRQILGSFENLDDLISTLKNIGDINPAMADRIERLMETGLKDKGIATIKGFDPTRFKLQFFSVPVFHPRTSDGFKRMEKIVLRATKGQKQREIKKSFVEGVNLAAA